MISGWLHQGLFISERLHVPYMDNPIPNTVVEAQKKGLSFFSNIFAMEENRQWLQLVFDSNETTQLPEKAKDSLLKSPGFARSAVLLKNINIFLGNYVPKTYTDEENDILIRFANVFEQSYIRFLDLKKAEARAREAQIEASLERVRSRSLGMLKTDELQEVVHIVATELKNLGVILDTGGTVICTYFQDSKDVIHWTATEDPVHPSVPYYLPYFKDELFDAAWGSKNNGDNYFAKEFSFEVKNAFYHKAFKHSDYKNLPEEYKKVLLESKSHGIAWAWSKNSAIMVPSIQGNLPTIEEKNILIRFAKVFEQAYIRFLDLQKAEAQAREAQIEAALERVRSRAMAMHSSNELADVAKVMFNQIKLLGGDLFAFGIVLCDKNENIVEQWHGLGEGEMMSPFQVPIDLDYIHRFRYDQWKAGVELFSIEIPSDYIAQHFERMFELPSVKAVKEDLSAKGINLVSPPWEIDYGASFKNGYLLVSSLKLFKEAKIFPRFAKVFEQAYTRFLDLKKAEAQAREAQIEAALERIRSKSLGMYKTDDLRDVVSVLFEQMQGLSVDMGFASVSIFIFEEGSRNFNQWIQLPDDVASLRVPYFEHPINSDLFDAKESGTDYFAKVYTVEEKNSWLEKGFVLTDYKNLPEEFKTSLLEAPGYAMSTTTSKKFWHLHSQLYRQISFSRGC